eukprot:c20382_g1_i1.p1 GENE.c20382_g1_i1~~c20382_g1_i1.p1  ORF type:complete len:183 (-),score=28.08 c20382_g1_i1:253-741(-)
MDDEVRALKRRKTEQSCVCVTVPVSKGTGATEVKITFIHHVTLEHSIDKPNVVGIDRQGVVGVCLFPVSFQSVVENLYGRDPFIEQLPHHLQALHPYAWAQVGPKLSFRSRLLLTSCFGFDPVQSLGGLVHISNDLTTPLHRLTQPYPKDLMARLTDRFSRA